ncbi:MFS transporter [Nocardioides mesophilus]|uniref:MFS transporter n=2 Tax=Nocardioides mesophilus TaxID=433659 RepID=A0A7G9RHQ4_9ACTN|nr:MFS transporter [Nocardioides mesophilus]
MRWPDHRVAQVQRRTLGTLVVTQSLGGLGLTIGIAVAAVLAEEITGSAELAGLAQTTQVLGAAVASFLLAHLMGRRGRRPGLVLGYLLGAAGSALCVVAGVVDSFAVLLAGTVLLGSTTAANAQSRYAATDLARPEHRARSLSLVVWATTVGAVAGPNLTGPAGSAAAGLGLPALTGPFLFGTIGILAAAVVIALFMRPDPLTVAKQAALDRDPVVATAAGTSWSRVVATVRTRPGVGAGIAALALAHAVMIAVMVMTPLHMHHGGASLEVIGLVISVHVLGMFALSPVVGWAADRFGRPVVMGLGAAVLFASLFLAGGSPDGASVRIGAGLFLLGLGWSLCTVAASTLLSESAPIEVRTDVQGAADLVMGLTAAAAGVVAGVVMGRLGFVALNIFAALLVTGVVTAAEFARRAAARPDAAVDDVPAL